ncbi:MAG: hypothetical protein SH847_02750 [Roseiflexaceae bacterium]|nr:hypothetical protein [Roseiflexaceae bacterium]
MRISIIIDLDPQAASQQPQVMSIVTGQAQDDPGLATPQQPMPSAINAGAAQGMANSSNSEMPQSAISESLVASDAGMATGAAAALSSDGLLEPPVQQTNLSILSAGAALGATDAPSVRSTPQFVGDPAQIGMTSAGAAPTELAGT